MQDDIKVIRKHDAIFVLTQKRKAKENRKKRERKRLIKKGLYKNNLNGFWKPDQ